MIYRIRRNLDNIQESTTILAIYDDIMNLQILTRDIPRFRSFCVWWRDIQELVIFNNDRHLNIFYWFCADIEHFLLIRSVLHDIDHISRIDDVTIFGIFCDYSAFDDIHN
jgi:hypothetical protein